MKIGIKRILSLTTFLSAAVPMLLVGTISLYVLKSHLRNELKRESIVFSFSVAEQIRTYLLREPVRVLALARDHAEAEKYRGSDRDQFFHDVLRTYDYFDSIYLLNSSGTVMRASRTKNAADSDLVGMDLSSQQAFRDAIDSKRASWSSSQTLSNGEPTIALCLPVRNGVIMANLRLNELSRIINEASSGRHYTAFVVEKGGRIVAHPDSSLVERRENVGGLPLLKDSSEVGSNGVFELFGVRYYGSVVPIRETEWRLVVAKRLEIAEQPIHFLENSFLLGIGVMLLLVACGAVIGNRIISRPLGRMEEQSRLVAEGRFDEVFTVDSSCREVALLSETITAMAAEVQQREFKLHDQNDQLLATEEMLRTQIDEYHETHDQLIATEEMLRVQLSTSENNQLLLSKANQRLETMINASPLAIVSLDAGGRISLWNRTATTLFGCSPGESDHTLKGLFTSEKSYQEFFTLLAEEQYLRLPEVLLTTCDRRPLVVSIVSAPLASKDQQQEYLLMVEDVTARAQLEEQLHQAQKMDVIGQLAGGIAHDFNNMLAGILASAELIKHRLSADDNNMKMVDTIINAASRSADLTRSLLAFSRKGAKENKAVAVNDTILAVIDLLERTIDKGIHIETSFTVDNPLVMGDPAQLQNALLNLGVNARDAMPEGGTLSYITSQVTLDAADCQSHQILLRPGTYLKISVSDTGVGIPREILSRIFEPFFTTKAHGKGTGLGLAAVYGTIRDHHGSINVQSEPGRGTVFNVYLPLGKTESAETSGQGANLIKGHGGILLVDDEEILRSVGRDLLEELGYTVYLAEDGLQGIEEYAKHRDAIDLVLLDMVMPNLNGRETLARLKQLNPDVRVLFASGFHREGTDSELTQLGAKGFIGKPYNMNELSSMVAKAITP